MGLKQDSSAVDIGEEAFRSCSALTNAVIGFGVHRVGPAAFRGCVLLASITLPDSVKELNEAAFYNCRALTELRVGKSLVSIGADAFRRCEGLRSLSLPASLTNLGSSAFSYCSNLERVYFAGAPPATGAYVFFGSPKVTVYFLPTASGWGATFGDRPTKLWDPEFTAAAFGRDGMRLTLTGTPEIPIAVDRSTNLNALSWSRILITNLTQSSLELLDPAATTSAAFYRIAGP